MSEQIVIRARQNCCRLCLASDDECVSIYGNLQASDKESISNKIHACVDIKVAKDDSLSTKICHICISYLNCWQSFKNRCIAAQRKQEQWLIGANVRLEKELHDLRAPNYDESLNNGINLSTTNGKLKHIPIQIKEEPLDECEDHKLDEDDSVRCDIDPTQFLATDVIEEEELKRLAANKNLTITKSGGENGPQILTSLGLQSIGNDNVSPFAFLSASLGASNDNLSEFATDTKEKNMSPGAPSQKPHDCRICKMKFSTRANARRHERNLHGLINDMSIPPLSVSTSSIPTTVQTSTPKNVRRKSNVVPLTPEMMGIYEYDKPEKYRHMLTSQKLAFIDEFEEFLKQYQTLTCKCCSKVYPKYKNFMAHMRKKYPRLPRASCFKCLKQFESKAIFVSHVKRRNCINLYKLYMSDPTIEKYDKIDKMKAKELLGNKQYECKLCPKEFRLKLDFRNHVNEDHNETLQKKEASPDTCVFCDLKIDDTVERKRHYNNMECILNIRCSTCNTKFETHQTFLEHVYKDHVPIQANRDSKPSNLLSDFKPLNDVENKTSTSPQKSNETPTVKEVESVPPVKTQFHSRMPQNCKICGARYNNYNNVLRHMEAKHPDQLPQTYKCSLCYVGFPRLTNLREHMWDVHNKKLAKPKRDAEIYCRICLEKFNDKDSWVKHQTEQHDRYICCICFAQYDDVAVFKEHIKIHTSLSYSRQQSSTQNSANTSQDDTKYTGRFDYVMKDLMSITNGNNDNKDDTLTGEPPSKKPRMETESNQAEMELDLSTKMETNDSEVKQKQLQSSSSVNSNANGDKKTSVLKQSSNLYECQICHSVFNSSQGLSNHMRAHNAQEMARRASLGLPTVQKSQSKHDGSENPSKLIKNNQILSLEQRFRRMRCRLCQRRFSSKKVYRRHMLVDHHVQNVQFIHCAICRAEFAHEKGLKVHMFKIHGEILKDIGVENLQYECDICSIVYKSEEELMSHKQSVHNLAMNLTGTDATSLNNSNNNSNNNDSITQNNENTQYWFQCRYCASNFDSNKKLAIHINIHDEVDSSDYSCKDCGNVYSGRKSLWVHRYKKHPVLPSPSFCDICNKMFFTKEHFEFHMQHLHKIPINKIATNQNNLLDGKKNKESSERKPENQVEKKDNHKEIIHVSGEDIQTVQVPVTHATQIPQVPCTVCQMKFSDEETFTKHMKIHEESFYTDNPLAAMFDTEPEDPDLVLQKRINENGEFVCDICPKTFQQLTALKVHRNWHFRSDGKLTQADPNIWQSFAKKRKNSPANIKCKYCSLTFTSSNNLKHHVLESHKEVSDKIKPFQLENLLQCKKCNRNFKTHFEWIEHKISDIKDDSSFNWLEWRCDICGKTVSRKDRLLQHMNSHLRENEPKTKSGEKKYGSSDCNSEIKSDISETNSNSRDVLSHDENNAVSSSENALKNSESADDNNLPSIANVRTSGSSSASDSDSETDDENDDDQEDNDDDDDNADNENSDNDDEYEGDKDEYNDDEEMNDDASGPHSCDLCQITFDTAQQLTAHVPMHFFHQSPIESHNKSNKTQAFTETEMSKMKESSKQDGEQNIEDCRPIKIKLERNDKETSSSPKSGQKELNNAVAKLDVQIKVENECEEGVRNDDRVQYPIKKEVKLENVNEEPKKQVEKLIIHRKDLTIKKESTGITQKSLQSRKSVDDILSSDDETHSDDESDDDDDDDNDDDDDESYEYPTNDQPISVDLSGFNTFESNASNSEDDNDEDDDNNDNIDDKHAKKSTNQTVGEEIIGEEIVHDNAEYHENNIVDLNSYADSSSVVGDIDNENDDVVDDNGHIENYEHFIDNDDGDDDGENHSEGIDGE